MSKVYTIGISPCPNDTFIFEAMLHNKVETHGLKFELIMADVEELNNMALQNELDITKISYNAFSKVWERYVLLNSGSALGKGNGPLLISKYKIYPDEIDNLKIAIPGINTTANMLLTIAYPNAKNKSEYLFSDIEEVILSGECDAGLIIHENRFTYEEKGLKKILDLGAFWEEKTKSPIPLGGIAIKRTIESKIQKQINEAIRNSILFAYENKNDVMPFIRQHAQEMNEEVILQHIDLYVNNYSIDMGTDGRKAIELFYKEIAKIQKLEIPKQIFI